METDHKRQRKEDLFRLIAGTTDPSDVEALFADLCTVKEVENMAERLFAAKLLMEGNTYQQIMAQIRELVCMLPANNEDDLSYEDCADDLNLAILCGRLYTLPPTVGRRWSLSRVKSDAPGHTGWSGAGPGSQRPCSCCWLARPVLLPCLHALSLGPDT